MSLKHDICYKKEPKFLFSISFRAKRTLQKSVYLHDFKVLNNESTQQNLTLKAAIETLNNMPALVISFQN